MGVRAWRAHVYVYVYVRGVAGACMWCAHRTSNVCMGRRRGGSDIYCAPPHAHANVAGLVAAIVTFCGERAMMCGSGKGGRTEKTDDWGNERWGVTSVMSVWPGRNSGAPQSCCVLCAVCRRTRGRPREEAAKAGVLTVSRLIDPTPLLPNQRPIPFVGPPHALRTPFLASCLPPHNTRCSS